MCKPPTWTDLSWKIRFSISIINYIGKVSRHSDGSINRRLLNLINMKAPPSSKPCINHVTTSDTILDPSRNLWFRLYVPTTTDNDVSLPVIVYFHGGGFALMSADSLSYDNTCRRFARELKAVIISVNYRLSPEHRFPCQYQDGFDVLKFIDENPNFKGFPINANLNKCFIGGDSAGGNLAHHVAVKACEHEFRSLKVNGVIAIQPFFGGEERTESEVRLVRSPLINMEVADWFWRAFLPVGSDRDHPAANVFGPRSNDITGLNFPPTIVFVGGYDPLQDWQKGYYQGLKKYGKQAHLIEYANAFHAFYSFPELPEYSLFIKEVSDFVQKQSAK